MKIITILFLLGNLYAFGQLDLSPFERLEIEGGKILKIVPNPKFRHYSYYKNVVGESMSGSDDFNKFVDSVSIGPDEEILIFEQHSSFTIAPRRDVDEFILTCIHDTLSFGGGITFQQAVIRNDGNRGTIVKMIKDAHLTAEDSRNWEKSGLPLEEFVGSGQGEKYGKESTKVGRNYKGGALSSDVNDAANVRSTSQFKDDPDSNIDHEISFKFLIWIGVMAIIIFIYFLLKVHSGRERSQ